MVKFRANFKKVEVVYVFIKKSKGFCDYGIFCDFLKLFFNKKSHGSGLWTTGPQLALGPWWTHDHGVVRPLRGSRGRRDSSERERGGRRSLGFSPIAPLKDGAAEIAT
jgi:hypothetical protein